MEKNSSTPGKETILAFGAGFGVTAGVVVGSMFGGIGIAAGIPMGIILGTVIALVFGKEIMELFSKSSSDDTKQQED